ADAGTDCDANAVIEFVVQRQVAVGQRLLRSGDGIVHERVVPTRLLARHVLADVKPPDRATEACRVFGHIEFLDGHDAALPGTNARPRGRDVQPHGRNQAQSGDYYAALSHDHPLCKEEVSAGAGRPSRPAAGSADSLCSAFGIGLDVIDRVLDLDDLLGFLVGNIDFELFFQRHHQFHGVQRVSTQIIDEGSLGRDLVFADAELLGNNLLYSILYVAHRFLSCEMYVQDAHIRTIRLKIARHSRENFAWPPQLFQAMRLGQGHGFTPPYAIRRSRSGFHR